MPYIGPPLSREVGFDPIVTYSPRSPRDDEKYVMKEFNRHADRCSSCADPYKVYKEGKSLCAEGRDLAELVAQYLYTRDGQAYSSVDEKGNRRIQVEIPAGCDAVRGLLKAMEHKLRLHRQTSVKRYDSTYDVRERRSSTNPPSYSSSRQPRREKTYIGKGSLFEEDMMDRERQSKFSSRHGTRSSTYYDYESRLSSPSPVRRQYDGW